MRPPAGVRRRSVPEGLLLGDPPCEFTHRDHALDRVTIHLDRVTIHHGQARAPCCTWLDLFLIRGHLRNDEVSGLRPALKDDPTSIDRSGPFPLSIRCVDSASAAEAVARMRDPVRPGELAL